MAFAFRFFGKCCEFIVHQKTKAWKEIFLGFDRYTMGHSADRRLSLFLSGFRIKFGDFAANLFEQITEQIWSRLRPASAPLSKSVPYFDDRVYHDICLLWSKIAWISSIPIPSPREYKNKRNNNPTNLDECGNVWSLGLGCVGNNHQGRQWATPKSLVVYRNAFWSYEKKKKIFSLLEKKNSPWNLNFCISLVKKDKKKKKD